MTEATEADRTEQQQAVTPSAGTPDRPADDVPEADGIEQQQSAVQGVGTTTGVGTVEADEYDVLEQQAEAPLDEDDLRG